MAEILVTIKFWASTRRLANIVRAYTGESLVAFLHRLVTEEATRLGVKGEE